MYERVVVVGGVGSSGSSVSVAVGESNNPYVPGVRTDALPCQISKLAVIMTRLDGLPLTRSGLQGSEATFIFQLLAQGSWQNVHIQARVYLYRIFSSFMIEYCRCT